MLFLQLTIVYVQPYSGTVTVVHRALRHWSGGQRYTYVWLFNSRNMRDGSTRTQRGQQCSCNKRYIHWTAAVIICSQPSILPTHRRFCLEVNSMASRLYMADTLGILSCVVFQPKDVVYYPEHVISELRALREHGRYHVLDSSSINRAGRRSVSSPLSRTNFFLEELLNFVSPSLSFQGTVRLFRRGTLIFLSKLHIMQKTARV